MRKIAIIITILCLNGCSTIGSSARSEDTIKEKAAFALGTTPDKVSVSNITNDMNSVRFNVTSQDRVFQCYYTTSFGIGGAFSSDAICSPTDGKPLPTKGSADSGSCNALLEAANKC